MTNKNQYILLSTWVITVLTLVSGQHTVKNATLVASDTLFSTPGYVDSLNYGINTARDYRFQTYYPNHSLLMTVIEFEMEPSDRNGACLYDKLTLYNGYDDSAPVLDVLCGTIAAGTTYQTTGDTVYAVFYSDSTNTFKGFQMSMKSVGPTTTTSTSTTSTTSTTTTTPSPTTTTVVTTANTNSQQNNNDSGQHTVKNATLVASDTLFSSPGYVDSLNYGINTTRDYRFKTYCPDHSLLISVIEFEMEPSDKNGDCLFDKLTLYNGYDDSAPVLDILCGTIPAGTTYQTTGNTVYAVFYSDYTNTFKGFQMSVKSVGPTTTTSTTNTSTTSTTTSTTSTTTTTVVTTGNTNSQQNNNDSGQHTVKNSTLVASDTLFSSPGYVDSLNYGRNTTRDYRFQTYCPDHSLLISVIEFEMEPSDKNGDCLFDKLTLYNGYDDSAPVLDVLCGTIPAGTTYQTTGDTVYAVFYSDYTNTYKGFQMSVKSDGPTTTTSTTTTSTTSTTTSTTSTTTTTVVTTGNTNSQQNNNDSGRHTVKNATLTASDTLFSSPGYVDSLNYGINTTRDYRFQTYYPNHSLLLTVIEFEMEQSVKNGDCLYDRLTLFNGYDDSAPVLDVLCGTIPAGTTYQTTGDTVFAVFYSDYTHTYKGFQMSVKSNGPTTPEF